MSLQNWERNGWLRPHKPTRAEIIALLALAERDLKSAQVKGLDNDWRFNIAYNAALQSATAALVASGYSVPKGDSHHFRVIGSLEFTVQLERKQIEQLDRYRKKRNITIYDIAGAITDGEAATLYVLANDVFEGVHAWLLQHHASLMQQGTSR